MTVQTRYDIGFDEALACTLRALAPLAPVDVPVGDAGGLVVAEDCTARVDCPSSSIALRDGYAVASADLTGACASRPVRLRVVGRAVAGPGAAAAVRPRTAVKITTGARIPPGADAVIAGEFTAEEGQWVLCHQDAAGRRNILERGHDVRQGSRIVARGETLTPAGTGLLAAGGIAAVRVHPRPRIGVIATGDEVVTPGSPLRDGQLYASNVVTLRSWLRRFGMDAEMAVVGDHAERLAERAANMLERVDVLLTSGGAWKSDRDLTVDTLKAMGAQLVFHRVRMGPGKAVALLVIGGKTLFCLPGGPPSNEIAFLQLALPGLLRLSGRPPVPFELVPAVLTEGVGGDRNWTQFVYAALQWEDGRWLTRPLRAGSRLQSQAEADALIRVPEGVERVESGTWVNVQMLHHDRRIRILHEGCESAGGSATSPTGNSALGRRDRTD